MRSDIKVFYSHPARQQNVPARPVWAHQMGLQAFFLTGLYFKANVVPYSLVRGLPSRLREPILGQLQKRRSAALPDDTVISVSGVLPEALLRPMNFIRTWNLIHDWCASRWLRSSGHNADHKTIFHGFQGSCERSIGAARQLGMVTALEITQPISTWAVLPKERARLGLSGGETKVHREDLSEISLTDFIVVQSAWSMTGIRELRPDARIILLHMGIDTERFSPGTERAPGFRAIFVGQICVRKGIHRLLEAWRQVKIPDAELLVAGVPTDELGRKLVGEHIPGVRWLGHQSAERLAELYRSADVFVGPSLSEGGFNAVYEAGASGLPCIVSDRAGSFVRDGVEGFIVSAGDVADLSEKLNVLGQNVELRRRMGTVSRERAEQLSWDRFGERLVLAYEYMLAAARDPRSALCFFEA